MVIATLDLYSKGLSVRQIQHHLSTVYECEASHVSAYGWIKKYVALTSRYVKRPTPKVGRRWRADDTSVKANGQASYLWDALDRKTRCLLVSELTTGRSTEGAYAALQEALTRRREESRYNCLRRTGILQEGGEAPEDPLAHLTAAGSPI